jgi:5-methyltetrahydrofolate--homocysteine methyltransferase
VLYKDDWPDAQERMTAWWEGDLIDRPAMMVTARREGAEGVAWDSWDFARFPDDPIRSIERFEARCASTFFGGEAFPNCWINLGAGALSAFMGASPVFYSETVWFETPTEWDELEDIQLDPRNKWWSRAKRATQLGTEKGEGKWFVAMTDLGGILDIAQSLRGKKRLMVDLFRHPEEVKALCSRVVDIWHDCYDDLHAIVQDGMEGSSTWMGIWCREKWYSLQCDFAYMLSPAKFKEFALPYIAEQCRRLDHTVCRLECYGQIPHLDMLLGMPERDAIQWVPGAGKSQCGDEMYFPMYKKIKAAGKGLTLNTSHNEVERVCREVGPEGILFQTSCPTEGEATALLSSAEKWA